MSDDASVEFAAMPPGTPKVFSVLKQCAADGDTIPYGDLARNVWGTGARPVSAFPALDYIRDHVCLPRDLPWLWVLAVNGQTRRPGPGAWRDTGVELKTDEHWGKILGIIYAHDWSDVSLDGEQQDGAD